MIVKSCFEPIPSKTDVCFLQPRSQGFRMRTRERRESPGPISYPEPSTMALGTRLALVRAGHVNTPKMAVFDSYSSRSGEIFFNEIYKSSKQINSQKTSQSILFMSSEVWHESAEISEDPVDVF